MDHSPTLQPMGGMRATFYGVRGSTPFSAASHTGFGGNTCCVVVRVDDEDPIILDMGSGLFGFAQEHGGQEIRETGVRTTVRWDDVAGLPLFPPVLRPGGASEV